MILKIIYLRIEHYLFRPLMNHRRNAADKKDTERTPSTAMCAISSGLHKRRFNSCKFDVCVIVHH